MHTLGHKKKDLHLPMMNSLHPHDIVSWSLKITVEVTFANRFSPDQQNKNNNLHNNYISFWSYSLRTRGVGPNLLKRLKGDALRTMQNENKNKISPGHN